MPDQSHRKGGMLSLDEWRRRQTVKKIMKEARKNIPTPEQIEENLQLALNGKALTIPLAHLKGKFLRRFKENATKQYYRRLKKDDPVRVAWEEKTRAEHRRNALKYIEKLKRDGRYQNYLEKCRASTRRNLQKMREKKLHALLMGKFKGDKKAFEWMQWKEKNHIKIYRHLPRSLDLMIRRKKAEERRKILNTNLSLGA